MNVVVLAVVLKSSLKFTDILSNFPFGNVFIGNSVLLFGFYIQIKFEKQFNIIILLK